MNCSCISGADADYITQELSCKTRKARKEHMCLECCQPIIIGSLYEHFVGIDDGKLVTYRTCSPCVEIRGHFSEGGWLWGCVWEDMENCFPDLKAGGPCLEGLSPAAKEKLFEMWRRWKGLAA